MFLDAPIAANECMQQPRSIVLLSDDSNGERYSTALSDEVASELAINNCQVLVSVMPSFSSMIALANK